MGRIVKFALENIQHLGVLAFDSDFHPVLFLHRADRLVQIPTNLVHHPALVDNRGGDLRGWSAGVLGLDL